MSSSLTEAEPGLRIAWLGRIDYQTAERLQSELRDEILGGAEEALLLLEHEPVFTLGRNASEEDVKAGSAWLQEQGIDVRQSDRGGQVTYHGPGQLVGYPILDLKRSRRDVRLYVRRLQEVLVAVCADYGVRAVSEMDQDRIGVWVSKSDGASTKIASIGVHLRRWVTTHGFALNVATQLDHFSGIVVCGLQEVEMCSFESLGKGSPPLDEVAGKLAGHFARLFERAPIALDTGSSWTLPSQERLRVAVES